MREKCNQCHFLKSHCICHHIQLINNKTSIIVIRFPKEAKHPFNTINIAKLNFKNIFVFDTEEVDTDLEVQSLLNKFQNPILLFPNKNSQNLQQINNCENIDALIILDGTWDKAKRIYLKSQTLQNLPTAKLQTQLTTNYKIRKSNFENGVSSIEAIAYALSELEENISTDAALKAFHFFVEQQIKRQKKGSE